MTNCLEQTHLEKRKLNLEAFVKITRNVDLVDKSGGGANSHYVKQQVEQTVKEMIAAHKHPKDIKREIEEYIDNFELDNDELGEKTNKAMKELGFDVK